MKKGSNARLMTSICLSHTAEICQHHLAVSPHAHFPECSLAVWMMYALRQSPLMVRFNSARFPVIRSQRVARPTSTNSRPRSPRRPTLAVLHARISRFMPVARSSAHSVENAQRATGQCGGDSQQSPRTRKHSRRSADRARAFLHHVERADDAVSRLKSCAMPPLS